MKTFRKYFVEFLGVALSVTMIFSTVMSLGLLVRRTDFMDHCVVFACALISFSVYILVYYGLSNKNEAHLNPIITLAKMFSLDMKFSEGLLYIVSQLLGAIAGSSFVGFLFKVSDKWDQSKYASYFLFEEMLGKSGYILPVTDGFYFGENSVVSAVIVEIVVSFVMVLVFLAVSNKKNRKKYSGIVCGMAVALSYFELMLITRSFANPAFVLGSIIMNLINGTMYNANNLWIFLGMPFIGAVLAAIFYNLFIYAVRKRNAIEAFFAEFIAMFLYVMLAAYFIMEFNYYSSTILNISYCSSITSAVSVGIIGALLYICLYHTFESITDVHLNPIVSIALWIDRKISFLKAFTNIIAQIIGATLGLLLAYKFRVDYARIFDGTTDWTCECMDSSHSIALADSLAKYKSNLKMELLLEIVLAAIFIVFVLYAYKNMENVRNLYIGAALAVVYFIDTFFNIMSVNPAKSVASAILNYQKKKILENVWIYIVGPIIGAVLVAVVYRIIEKRRMRGVANEE